MSDYIADLLTYLSPERPKKHAALVTEELYDRVRAMNTHVVRTLKGLISYADPVLLRIYLDKFGENALQDIMDTWGSDHLCPLLLFDASNKSPHNICSMLEILIPHARSKRQNIINKVMVLALQAEDPAILDAGYKDIKPTAPELTIALFKAEAFKTHNGQPGRTAVIASILERNLDPNDPEWQSMVQESLRQQQIYPVAIALKLGVDIRPALDKFGHPSSGSWPARLHRRLKSAHDWIEIVSTLPDVETILTTERKTLVIQLAGLSAKEAKSLKREAKRLKRKQTHEAYLARKPQQAYRPSS